MKIRQTAVALCLMTSVGGLSVMKSKMLGAAFIAAVTFGFSGLSPARASTYNLNFDIGPTIHITGFIVTDCDNCALRESDFVSFSFTDNTPFTYGGNMFFVSIGLSSFSAVTGHLVYGTSAQAGAHGFHRCTDWQSFGFPWATGCGRRESLYC